jgi:subtilisin family serine protease
MLRYLSCCMSLVVVCAAQSNPPGVGAHSKHPVVALGDGDGYTLDRLYDPKTNRYFVLEPDPAVGSDLALDLMEKMEKESGSPFPGKAVAFLDSGVMHKHPALAKLKIVDKDFTGEGSEDLSGHGTAVLLIYVAATFHPERDTIYNLKVLDKDNSGTTEAIEEAMKWAAEKHVRIINMSLGVAEALGSSVCRLAEEIARKGILVVAAAGNDPNIPMCPAAASKELIIVMGQTGKSAPVIPTASAPAPRLVPFKDK